MKKIAETENYVVIQMQNNAATRTGGRVKSVLDQCGNFITTDISRCIMSRVFRAGFARSRQGSRKPPREQRELLKEYQYRVSGGFQAIRLTAIETLSPNGKLWKRSGWMP